MKIAVSGASGFLGSALLPVLERAGHEVVKLVREEPKDAGEIRWDPKQGSEPSALGPVDAVVHLAGESIAEGRWTEEKKRRIEESRTVGTRKLAETVAAAEDRPEVMVCASAVGYYGDRGEEDLDETSAPGKNFLSEVCKKWEAAADPAREAGVRVTHLRFGVILGAGGGALDKMLTPFKLGLGGRLGSGQQWMPWITRDDAVAVALRALEDESVAGPVNTVTPHPVRNATFTKALGQALGRPTILPMPAFAARLVFGEMADELLLASAKARPSVLERLGFSFRHPEIEPALRELVGRG